MDILYNGWLIRHVGNVTRRDLNRHLGNILELGFENYGDNICLLKAYTINENLIRWIAIYIANLNFLPAIVSNDCGDTLLLVESLYFYAIDLRKGEVVFEYVANSLIDDVKFTDNTFVVSTDLGVTHLSKDGECVSIENL
ncbi:MAG: hypothetical protein FWD06_07995 [Oscillospiraceae bacterium]|nr:hypothetical protein [Oscillospiraceae bacterium]